MIDVFIDGFDELDAETKALIAGDCGRVTRVKLMANAAKHTVFIAPIAKLSDSLGRIHTRGIPIEVIPMAYKCVANEIEGQFKGRATLRMVSQGSDHPFVTECHNYLIDWQFDGKGVEGYKWVDIYREIKLMPGVVDLGLLFMRAGCSTAYLGLPDETVHTINI